MDKIQWVFLWSLIALCLKSETIILKPTNFVSFYFSDKAKTFSLKQDTDHRSRIYKIELINKSKAIYLEKSDDGKEFTLISENSSPIHDSTTILDGVIIRTISVCFLDKNGGSPDSFHIEITDNYSIFTKSDGSIFGNHIECGYVIEEPNKQLSDLELSKNLNKSQIIAYIYGAKIDSISKNDLILVSESNVKTTEWNTCASNCVVISRKFLESSAVGKEEINILKDCGSRFYALSSEFESNAEKSEDVGIRNFFRKYAVLSSWMAIEYTALIESIISGNKSGYQKSSDKLKSLAQLKLNTFQPIINRIESVNRSGAKSAVQEFSKIWGINENSVLKNSSQNLNQFIIVGNQKTQLDQDEWNVLKSDSEYSVNLSKKTKRSNEKYNQIVTVFNIEMTKDRKSGVKLSENIYFEAFRTSLDSLTIQIRIDKGSYWVLSRQVFQTENDELLSPGEYADESKALIISKRFQDEISSSIFMMNKIF
jgi:hypothetical protein